MEYRRMGYTGLQLSVLSYGSWVSFHKQIDDGVADELMGICYDQGINFFDNAEAYALGESEKMMGRVLKNKSWDRTSYTLSSKAYFGWRGKHNKPNQTGLSRKHLFEACHEALGSCKPITWLFIAIVRIQVYRSAKWCGRCIT
jgi:aryl-alcohol dehydrogenase-like predicted oxidoreductase